MSTPDPKLVDRIARGIDWQPTVQARPGETGEQATRRTLVRMIAEWVLEATPSPADATIASGHQCAGPGCTACPEYLRAELDDILADLRRMFEAESQVDRQAARNALRVRVSATYAAGPTVPSTPHGDYQTPPSAAELDEIERLGYDRETFRYRDGTFDATSSDLLRRTIAAKLQAAPDA